MKIITSLIAKYLIGITAIMVSLSSNSFAGEFYTAKLKNVAPLGDGTVIVTIAAGTGETRFIDPTSRGLILEDVVGDNKMYAAVLTALSLNYELLVELPSAPTWAPQAIISVAVKNP